MEHFKSGESRHGGVDIGKPGKKFLLVHCGGGTTNVSAFIVRRDNGLQLLHQSAGECPGGQALDQAFCYFLEDLLGFDGIASLERLEKDEIMEGFEKAKSSITTEERIHIKLPPTVEEAFQLSFDSKSCERFQGKVQCRPNWLLIHRDIFLSFFQKPVTSISHCIREVQAHEKVGSVDAIFLTGGFSESDVIQNAVREAFPRDLVLVAPSPSSAVLSGAVMYGHNHDVITARPSAFAYGVDAMLPFKDGVHDERKLFVNEAGERWCDGCFSGYIRINKNIKDGVPLPFRNVTVSRSDQTELVFNIYRSTRTEPLYVDEVGVEKVGTLSVPMPNTSDGLAREIKTTMRTQGSELMFIARDVARGKEFTTKIAFQ